MGAVGDVAGQLLEAGRCLEAMVVVWRRAGTILTEGEEIKLWDVWVRFLALVADIGDLNIPKKHLTTHLLDKVPWFGNPMNYSNWRDESDNHTLKLACRRVSQATFEPMLLLRMSHVLTAAKGRKRVRGED